MLLLRPTGDPFACLQERQSSVLKAPNKQSHWGGPAPQCAADPGQQRWPVGIGQIHVNIRDSTQSP